MATLSGIKALIVNPFILQFLF